MLQCCIHRADELQDDPEGVLVCLQCFNGGCFGEGRRHAWLHYEKTKHIFGVVIKRTRKEGKKRVSVPPQLMDARQSTAR